MPLTRTSRSRVALVVFDARRSCEVRLDRQTAPHDRTALVTLESLDELAGATRRSGRASEATAATAATTVPAAARHLLGAVSRPVRRGRHRTAGSRTSVLLRYAQDLAGLHSARAGSVVPGMRSGG